MRCRAGLVCLVLVMNSLWGDVELSFDTLFPETPVKQLYDTVIQLCADVAVIHDETVSMQTKKDIADLILGQLVRIRYLLAHMHSAKTHALNNDDIDYLTVIMHGLSSRFNHFFAQEQIHAHWAAIAEAFDTLRLA